MVLGDLSLCAIRTEAKLLIDDVYDITETCLTRDRIHFGNIQENESKFSTSWRFYDVVSFVLAQLNQLGPMYFLTEFLDIC